MVTRTLASCLLLAAAAACSDPANDRFEAGQQPVSVTLPEDVQLTAYPARTRTGDDGAIVVRAAAPVVDLTLSSDAPAQASFVLENIDADSAFAPAPASQLRLGPLSVLLNYTLDGDSDVKVHVTPPGTGAVHFAYISDVHDNEDTFATFVADVHANRPEMVLFNGDLTIDGTADQFQTMADKFADLEVPIYATLGNHELMGDAVDRFQALIGPSTVSFDVRGVHFLIVDSAGAGIAPESYDWMAGQLADRPAGPALVFTHIPPVEPDGARDHAFKVRDDAEHFLEMLAGGEVSHLFVGHVHSYSEYTLRDIPVTLSGGGGGKLETPSDVHHHYLDVQVDLLAADPVKVTKVDLD
jgi:predicted phosphodiesterase